MSLGDGSANSARCTRRSYYHDINVFVMFTDIYNFDHNLPIFISSHLQEPLASPVSRGGGLTKYDFEKIWNSNKLTLGEVFTN